MACDALLCRPSTSLGDLGTGAFRSQKDGGTVTILDGFSRKVGTSKFEDLKSAFLGQTYGERSEHISSNSTFLDVFGGIQTTFGDLSL